MGLDRRGFIQFLVGGAVGTLVTPIPWKLTDDLSIWTQSWPWIPRNLEGQSEYVKTVSKLCPTNCALTVRSVAGHPIRAEGDPDNPLSGGKISSLAAAEVQMLYSPARLRRPLAKSDDGVFRAVSWDEAMAMLEEKLGSIKGVQDKLAVISGDQNGSINEVLSGLCQLAGSQNFFIMPSESQNARRVWSSILHNPGQPGFDVENSDYVLAIGADILESWGPAVRNRRAFSATHPHGADPEAKYVYAGPVQNNTATGADEWTPIRPGTELALAGALANEVLSAGRSFDGLEFDTFATAVNNMTSAKAAAITGLSEEKIKTLAQELLKAECPLVIVDSSFTQGAGAASLIACIGLNLLLGGWNQPGGMVAVPNIVKVVDAAMDHQAMFKNDLMDHLLSMKDEEKPEMLIVYDANPVYALPQANQAAKALQDIPFKVSFTSFLDETAMACDLVLPTPLGLERYDDVITPYGMAKGVYCPLHPVTKPLVDAPAAGDVLLQLAARLGMDMGFESFKAVLEAKAESLGESFDDLQGQYAEAPGLLEMQLPLLTPSILRAALGNMAGRKTAPLSLAPVKHLNYGTAETATPPFNLKTVRDTTLLGKMSFVSLNGATASKLEINEGDKVRLSSEVGECEVLAHIDEGVMPDVVAAPLGFGHTAFDDFTRGKGANTAQLMKVSSEAGSGFSTWTSTEVKLAKIQA